LKRNRPRALIQMATGSGKTIAAITAIYRLIKYGGARRVLFLVDRSNLGESKCCLYFKRLADLDRSVLMRLVTNSIAEAKQGDGWRGGA
jgi:type I site-specific restriction endonuclease